MTIKCLARGCDFVARDYREIARHIGKADHPDCGEAYCGPRRPGPLPEWIRQAMPAHN